MTEIPLYPPVEWFTPPDTMPKDAGCIVEADGRIYGYLCHWGSVLMDGSSDRWTPPRSRNGYGYAHTGDTIVENGETIKTANLGGDFGHAPQGAGDLAATQDFYENTQTQLARIRYGEDEHGVWFAGACWPSVSELDMAKLRASARSGHWCAVGDWRDVSSGRAGYELVGACLVNVPGLKYQRADRAASGILSFNPLLNGGEMAPLTLNDRHRFSVTVDGVDVTDQVVEFTVSAAADLPLHNDRNTAWDSTAAETAIRKWASSDGSGAKETIDWTKYGDAHFWKDSDPALTQDFGGYKLLFADVFNGRAEAVWRGVSAVAAVLQGSRGGTDIPAADQDAIKARVATYYDRFAKEFADPTIVPPWKASIERVAASGTIQLAASAPVNVGGVLLVEGVATEDGRLINPGAAVWRDLPLPLYSSLENLPGHDEADLVGRIDTIERDATDNTILNWTGVVFPDSAGGAGQETLDAISNKQMRGISIDGIVGPDDGHLDEFDVSVMDKIVIAGATLTPMPAISTATVTLLSSMNLATEGRTTMDNETAVDEAAIEDAAAGAPPAAVDGSGPATADAVSALADRVEYLIGLTEQSQMAARMAAVNARLAAVDA